MFPVDTFIYKYLYRVSLGDIFFYCNFFLERRWFILGKAKSKNEKLARQILENKGIKFDDWLEEQYQNIIDENIELLISSLLTAKELGE